MKIIGKCLIFLLVTMTPTTTTTIQMLMLTWTKNGFKEEIDGFISQDSTLKSQTVHSLPVFLFILLPEFVSLSFFFFFLIFFLF